jgi:hypothetical protein
MSDYGVQASIRLDGHPATLGTFLGIVVRTTRAAGPTSLAAHDIHGIYSGAYIQGSVARDDYPSSAGIGYVASNGSTFEIQWIARTNSPLTSTAWHVVRAEVQGTQYRLLIDGQVIDTATSPRFQKDRVAGIFCLQGSLAVRSFRIYKLQ